MKATTALGALAGLVALAGSAAAHMEMVYPPPLRSKNNPFAGSNIDYSMTAPLSASGSDYPCKGYLSLMGTSQASAVATWTPGQSYNMTISGGANHNGGSCQAALSLDGGKTFKVLQSIVGGCPGQGTSSYDFSLPADTPASQNAIFAWTWFNNVGNREMYMNCAVVNIGGGGAGKRVKKRASAASFSSRPDIFIANVNNNCKTTEGSDVQFPDPGPDVTTGGSKVAPPVGECGAAAAVPDPAPAPVPAPTTAAPAPAPPATTAPAPAPPTSTAKEEITIIPVPVPTSATVPGGVFITVPTAGSPSAEPTTLVSVTVPATAPTSPGAAPPAPAPTSGSGSGSGSGGAMAAGTPCTSEGMWNCVSGTQFQRCASGQWSQMIPMAAGTKCQAGMGDSLVMLRKRGGARRFKSAWVV